MGCLSLSLVPYKIVIILFYLCGISANNKTPLKVVYEQSGPNHIAENNIDNVAFLDSIAKPKVKLAPTNFSGPEHLKELKGLCFSFINEKYKFKVCPFDNVTQEEVQALQEPYKGILGVWGEWIIINNTFVALHFVEGNKCGAGVKRSTKIYLKCGPGNRFIKMMEPSRCNYKGTLETPLVCGRNSLLVYPRLPKYLQKEWDRIETERHYEILTQKGYEEDLNNIFIKANYILPSELKSGLNSQVLWEDAKTNLLCEKERETLQQRVSELEEELRLKEATINNLLNGVHNN